MGNRALRPAAQEHLLKRRDQSFRTSLLLLVAILSGGCIRTFQSGTQRLAPALTINAGVKILVGRVQDGVGEDGVMLGSGELVTEKLLSELGFNGFIASRSDQVGVADLLASAKAVEATYLVVGRIPEWTDNVTLLSGKLDYAGLDLALYSVSDGRMVASSEQFVQGATHPDNCAGWLVSASIRRLLGRGGPPPRERPDC